MAVDVGQLPDHADGVSQLVLVHLSDIHLGGYEPGATFDEDEHLRVELERDLGHVTEAAGSVNGLILGGDIAGQGAADEFAAATRWITRLCSSLGVSEDDVYCVPGNHDVDWATWDGDPVLQALQEQLLTCPVEELRTRLERLFSSGPHRDLLLAALENYNGFAIRYGCDINPDRHWWHQTQTLGSLRIEFIGLTSSLLGGRKDTRDPSTSRLALGPIKVLRRRDTFSIVVCHHPLSWLRDRDQVRHHIERAHLQLFGHEHAHEMGPAGRGVRVHAGAVHPARDGGEPWEPSYNVIRLTYVEGPPPTVAVGIWPRRARADGTFGPLDPDEPCRTFSVTVDLGHANADRQPIDPDIVISEPPISTGPLERQVARAYAMLPVETRLAVAEQLGLVDREDRGLEPRVRSRSAFRRAVGLDRLNELQEALHAR